MTNLNTAFLRYIKVEIGTPTATAIVIDNMRISFNIQQDVEGTAAPSVVRIYNLAEATERDINDKWTVIRVSAGYSDRLDVVLDGEILKTDQGRFGLDRITNIMMTGKTATQTVAKVNGSWPGNNLLHNVLRDIVRDMGLAIGPLNSVPNDVVMDFAFDGLASRALDQLLRGRLVTWYQQGNTVFFSQRNVADRNIAEFALNENNGLVGTPTRTDTGIKARMLLSGQVALGQILNMQSQILQGRFKIVKLSHIGDNWTGSFVTELEASTLA